MPVTWKLRENFSNQIKFLLLAPASRYLAPFGLYNGQRKGVIIIFKRSKPLSRMNLYSRILSNFETQANSCFFSQTKNGQLVFTFLKSVLSVSQMTLKVTFHEFIELDPVFSCICFAIYWALSCSRFQQKVSQKL